MASPETSASVSDAITSREARAGEVHRGEGAGHVQDADVQPPVGVPPRDPPFERRGVARRDGDEELVVGQADDGAVVEDHALVVQHHAVADPAHREVGEPVRVQAFQELTASGPLTRNLPSVLTSITPTRVGRPRPRFAASCSGAAGASRPPT